MSKKNQVPFMVSVLLAVGAWISCLMLILCFSLSALRQSWIAGVIYTLFAALLAYVSEKAQGIQAAGQAFLTQLSLAFSLVGKTLLVIGVAEIFNFQIGGVFLLTSVLAIGSYHVFTQKMDRTLTVAAAGFAGMAYLAEYGLSSLAMEWAAVALFLISYIVFLLKKENLRPLAWGLMLVSAAPLMMLFDDQKAPIFGGLTQLFLGVGLVVLYAWQERSRFCLWVAAAILILTYLSNTGTAMGAALLTLGFVQKNLYQKVLGGFAFSAGLVWLYYNMQTTLLIKSYYLMITGILLLGIYVWQKRGTHAR